MNRYIPLILVLLALTAGPVHAQDEEPARASDKTVGLLFSASIHARASYGWDNDLDKDRLGVGVRRARFRSEFIFTPRTSLTLQFESSDRSLTAQDVFLAYQVNDALRMRFGRFLVPQPRSFIFTPQSRLDGVDRAAIGEIWGRHTVGEVGRDFGIDATWQNTTTTLQLAVSNGDGSWDRLQSNYRATISSGNPTDGVDRTAINVGASAIVKPTALQGIETGAYAAYNTSRNPNTVASPGGAGRTYASYGAHLYWGAEPGSQPIRLKADLMTIRYETIRVGQPGAVEDFSFGQRELGLALTAAICPTRYIDLYSRVEQYRPTTRDRIARPDLDVTDTFFSGGFSLSPSALRGGPFYRERFSLVYNNLYPDGSGHRSKHQIVFQAQLFI